MTKISIVEEYIKKYFFVFFFFFILLFYGNTIFNGFVHDDIRDIKNNVHVQKLEYFPTIFTECLYGYSLPSCKGYGFYYRPIGSLSNFIDFRITSDPWIFHLTNIFYLYILSLLLFSFLKTLIKNQTISFVGVLIFLSHPLISDAVNASDDAYDLLFGIFLLAMLIAYIRYRANGNYKYLITSVCMYLLALFTKESAIFTLALIPIYDFLFMGFKKEQYKKYLISLLYLIPLGFYLICRTAVLGSLLYNQPGFYNLTSSQQLTTAFGFYGKYILSIFYPLPLIAVHSFTVIGASDPLFILSILIIIFTTTAVFVLYLKHNKIVPFGFCMFLITLLPAILLFTKLGPFPYAERYMFVPLLGVALIISYFLKYVFEQKKLQTIKAGLIALLIFYFLASFFIVFNRNLDWKDNKAFASAVIRDDPKNVDGYWELGMYYYNNKDYTNATKLFYDALKVDPHNSTVLTQLNIMQAKTYHANGIDFNYPEGWITNQSDNTYILTNSSKTATITLTKHTKPSDMSVQNYLTNNASVINETLAQQGSALIPTVDYAFVRVWKNGNTNTMQFFLFKGTNVVEVIVSPANNDSLAAFNKIAGSISF